MTDQTLLYSKKTIAAGILRCSEGAILKLRERSDGGVTVIGPTGQKFTFSLVQLVDEAAREMAIEEAQMAKKTGVAEDGRPSTHLDVVTEAPGQLPACPPPGSALSSGRPEDKEPHSGGGPGTTESHPEPAGSGEPTEKTQEQGKVSPYKVPKVKKPAVKGTARSR